MVEAVEVFETPTIDPSPHVGTIALIYGGAMQSVHRSFYEMVPGNVNLLVNTKLWSRHMLHAGSFDAEAFAAHRAAIIEAVVETADFAACDSICIGGDLIQAAMGREWCAELREEIEDKVGVTVFTAMELVGESLRHLGARSVALVSPFPKERSDHLRGFLEADGFTVPVVRGVETTTNASIRQLERSLPYQVVSRALADGPAVDAVYLSCPVWYSNEAIQPLEDEFDLPIVTMFSPILWKGLQHLGIEDSVEGYGRLLRRG